MDAADSVIEKIKKAIRLARKTTEEGERATALRLAKSLADKNGIAFEELQVADNEADKAIHEADEKRSSTFEGSEFGYTCYILKQHFGVILMVQPLVTKPWMKKTHWIGTRINIEIARHVCHILLRESRKAFDEKKKEWKKKNDQLLAEIGYRFFAVGSQLPPLKRQTFMQGFFWAISKKLTEHPLRNDLERDLANAERKLLEYAQENKVESSQSKKVPVDADSLLAGADAGNKVNLARPCEGNTSIVPMLSNASQPRICG